MCLCVLGEGREQLRPQCTFHLLAVWRGSGCTGRGEVDRHLICCYLLSRPGCCVVCLTLVKSSGLIKPTVRQARAHKRDDESRGMEWALMDISVELHWQGWRLEALHTQIGSLFEVESGSGQHSLYRLLH